MNAFWDRLRWEKGETIVHVRFNFVLIIAPSAAAADVFRLSHSFMFLFLMLPKAEIYNLSDADAPQDTLVDKM